MRIIAATHADRHYGAPDPGHTEEGLSRLRAMKYWLGQPPTPPYVAMGTGRRFLEVARCVFSFQLAEDAPTMTTPFLGCADANMAETKDRVLPSGIEIPGNCYLKLADGARDKGPLPGFFQPWELIKRLEKMAKKAGCQNLCIATGAEFMNSLLIPGFKSEQGSIYEVFSDIKEVIRIF